MQIRLLKISQNIIYIILSVFLFEQLFTVVPNTEGWFVELTYNKNFFEIIRNDEILLPPLYPLFIWFLSKLSSQLIFLRIIGFGIGFLLFNQTEKLIRRVTYFLTNYKEKKILINLASKIMSLFLINFICKNSTYLLWYDFTIIVLITQIFIINLFLLSIDNFNLNNEKYKNTYLFLGSFLILGVLLKHSNMGVFLLCFQLSMLLIWLLFKKDRLWLNKIFFWQGISIGFCLILIFLNFLLDQNNFVNQFLSASVAAKGGEQIVFNFVMNGIDHLLNELKRLDTILLGIFLFLYLRNFPYSKYIGIFIFNLYFAYCIFNSNYNLAGYSIKIIVILFVSCLIFFIETLIFKNLSLEKFSFQKNNFNKLVFILFGAIGCLLGNFTSAGLGYNGYYIGLVIGLILQLTFFIELIKFTEKEKIITLK